MGGVCRGLTERLAVERNGTIGVLFKELIKKKKKKKLENFYLIRLNRKKKKKKNHENDGKFKN